MNRTASPTSATPWGLPPAMFGMIYCIAAALLYTAANVTLRMLVIGGDAFQMVAIRESMTPLLIGPWLVVCACRGDRVMPRGRILLLLILAGLATELVGNIAVFWALAIVGLAVEIPLVVGVTVLSATLMGRVFLGERVPPRSLLALAVLLVSIVLLNLGAGNANAAIAAHAPVAKGLFWVALAVSATCAAGVAFGLLSLSIRVAVTHGISPAATVVAITIFGPLTLGPICVYRSGLQHCLALSGPDFGLTVLTGIFNTAAFFCLSKGLQWTTIVHANVVNASQIAMAAVAGVLLFAEPLGGALIAGVVLTILGAVLIDRSAAAIETDSPLRSQPAPAAPISAGNASLIKGT